MEVLKISSMAMDLEVDDQNVKITRKMPTRTRVIPIESIVSVEIKKPGMLAGYIYFQTAAGSSSKVKSVKDLGNDENAFVYGIASKHGIAVKIKERIEEIHKAAANRQCNNGPMSSADEILKYKDLLDAVAITEEEYNAKKRQLLGI